MPNKKNLHYIIIIEMVVIICILFSELKTNSINEKTNITSDKKYLSIKENRIYLTKEENKETVVMEQQEETTIQHVTYAGYTTDYLNIRAESNSNSESIFILPFNMYIEYEIYDDNWAYIEYVNNNNLYKGYINRYYITDNPCNYEVYNIINNNTFKSFMPYQAITDTSSRQYKLQRYFATTSEYGIRKIDNRFCVAIGTYFGATVGQYIDLVLENGTVIECIMSDIKDNKDTNYDNIFTSDNGCCSEFIIDSNYLSKVILNSGDISSVNDDWNSPVVQIRIYNKNILEE